MLFNSLLHNKIHIRTVDYDGNDDSDYNRQEGEAGFAEVESVEERINQWKHFEKGVVDSVNQTRVHVGKSDCGIQNSDLHGYIERIDDDLMDC